MNSATVSYMAKAPCLSPARSAGKSNDVEFARRERWCSVGGNKLLVRLLYCRGCISEMLKQEKDKF